MNHSSNRSSALPQQAGTRDIDVREILRRKLRRLGCDGLASDDCGCGIGNLAPCGGDCLGCLPARSKATQAGVVWRPVKLKLGRVAGGGAEP